MSRNRVALAVIGIVTALVAVGVSAARAADTPSGSQTCAAYQVPAYTYGAKAGYKMFPSSAAEFRDGVPPLPDGFTPVGGAVSDQAGWFVIACRPQP